MSQKKEKFKRKYITEALNSDTGNLAVRVTAENDILYELLNKAIVNNIIFHIVYLVVTLYLLFILNSVKIIL